MGKQLHILNGDAAVPEFRKSGIDGDMVVWREALADGPVSDPIKGNTFWKKRADFIQGGSGGEGYADKVLCELNKLRKLDAYEEVVLWFEYDLFCQVNMLACLNFIHHDRISLVCLGDELGGQLQGLGQISAHDFITLYDQRTFLSHEDLSFAKSAWQAYTRETSEGLMTLVPSSAFKHIKPAMDAHLTRLPGKNGLNQPEVRMLNLIKGGIGDERKLIGTILRDQGYFGFGDLQYYRYLDQLRPLLIPDKLAVNNLGEKILEGKAVFAQPDQYIGGVFRPDYYQAKWG